MLADIDNYWQSPGDEKLKAESCFWIAQHYLNKVKDLVREHDFFGDCEEIEFFKNVKPEFTGYIEYFVLLSESLMFVPTDFESQKKYWTDEAKRFNRFYIKHKAFIQYYEDGNSNLDTLYFLRRNYYLQNNQPLIYDIEKEFSTTYDMLVGNYLAHKKYFDFVNERLRKLDTLKND